jgi:HPt (histidine-containing phosphotransfer) domain-containing protein
MQRGPTRKWSGNRLLEDRFDRNRSMVWIVPTTYSADMTRTRDPADDLLRRILLETMRSCTEALDIEAIPELVDLLPDYFAHRRADLDALWQALADGNDTLIRRLGHDMKGSGKLYGLPRISAIGARIEAAAAGNERREAALALTALESFLARAARSLIEPTPAAAAGLSAPRAASD